MTVRTTVAVVLTIFLTLGTASAAESVQVVRSDGEVTYHSGADGVVRTAQAGTALQRGDLLQLAEKASASIRFADGAEMDISGPAAVRFSLLTARARTVDLLYGTMNRFIVKSVTTGIKGVCRSYCALRNGTVFVRCEVGQKTLRAIYKLFSGGSDAQVGQGDERRPLTTQKPAVFMCDSCEPWCDRPGIAPEGVNRIRRLKVGDRVITLAPPEAFSVERTPDGGVLLTSVVPEGTFGVVTLDDYTTFYLGSGQSLLFGSDGEVDRHGGIIHIYGPLDRRGIYDDPVESPADSSFTGTED
jgi:hypothetical protein